MTLNDSIVDTTYIIADIETQEAGMKEFLFSLGCYPGEKVSVISRVSGNFVINVKNARYSIDSNLAQAIRITEGSNGSEMNARRKVG